MLTNCMILTMVDKTNMTPTTHLPNNSKDVLSSLNCPLMRDRRQQLLNSRLISE